jgi:glycosyltransferase involved in cell wall biosynthesis
VPSFLSNLDIFVLSSVYEGLPLAVLEAMAAGLPIVSTKVGGVPEVCPEGEVAFFAPPANPQALGAAMRKAANTSQLAILGENARRIVTETYSLSKTWLGHEELFRTLWLRRGYPLAALEQPA